MRCFKYGKSILKIYFKISVYYWLQYPITNFDVFEIVFHQVLLLQQFSARPSGKIKRAILGYVDYIKMIYHEI